MRILIAVGLFGLLACQYAATSNQRLEKRVDSLEQQLSRTYKPGFGEFMSSIQTHHAKLWFAGQHQNWELADFEIHEIMEAIEDIKTYQTERKESALVNMLNPSLDSLNAAITHHNLPEFQDRFRSLTITCNKCHQATEFGFNVVKVPDQSFFANQDFAKPQ